jgi:hypothetical protein
MEEGRVLHKGRPVVDEPCSRRRRQCRARTSLRGRQPNGGRLSRFVWLRVTHAQLQPDPLAGRWSVPDGPSLLGNVWTWTRRPRRVNQAARAPLRQRKRLFLHLLVLRVTHAQSYSRAAGWLGDGVKRLCCDGLKSLKINDLTYLEGSAKPSIGPAGQRPGP